jgi:preprotein translocase SecE subunit
MANFFKESMAELEHVVWPTHLETKKFFQAVVSIIAVMALFVYLLTLIFSNAFLTIRDKIHNAPAKSADISGSPTLDPNAIKVDAQTADGKAITVTPEVTPTPAPAAPAKK